MIQEGLLLNQQCQISYRRKDESEPESYPINPLGLVQRGKLMYLVCTIKTYQDLRILALHRVQAAELLDAKAIKPSGFDLDNYLASGAFGWGAGERIKLKVLFDPEVASHLYETSLSADQRITLQADGRLQVAATVSDGKQLLWWLLGFGQAVEVIEPKSLRVAVRSHLANALSRY